MNDKALDRLKEVRAYAIQCLKDEAEALIDLIPQLDENFDRAVEMMYRCRGKIIVTGVGKSGNIGAKIAATLFEHWYTGFFHQSFGCLSRRFRCDDAR